MISQSSVDRTYRAKVVTAHPGFRAKLPLIIPIYLGTGSVSLCWLSPLGTVTDKFLLSVIFGGIFLGLSWLMVCWIRRTKLIADSEGLTLQAVYGERRIPWTDVIEWGCSDRGTLFVRSANQTITFSLPYFVKALSIRQAVAERAPIGTSDWVPPKFRLARDEIRSFRSKPVKGSDWLPVFIVAIGFPLVYGLIPLVDDKPVRWEVTVGLIISSFVAFAPIAAFLLETIRQRHRYQLLHGDQKLTLSKSDLRWEDGSGIFQAKWEEISSVSIRPVPGFIVSQNSITVSTAKGSFCFNQTALTNSFEIRSFLRYYVPERARWEDKELEPGDFESMPDGRLLFTYKSRTSATLVFGAIALFMVSLIAAYFNLPIFLSEEQILSSTGDIWSCGLFNLTTLTYVGLCYWHCRKSHIILADDRLEYHFPFRSGNVPVKDIVAITPNTGLWLELENRAIWLPAGMNDRGGLVHELKQKAPWILSP